MDRQQIKGPFASAVINADTQECTAATNGDPWELAKLVGALVCLWAGALPEAESHRKDQILELLGLVEGREKLQ